MGREGGVQHDRKGNPESAAAWGSARRCPRGRRSRVGNARNECRGRTAAVVAVPQVALDWNTYAVTAVRAATTMDGVPSGSPPRALYQVEGLIYMGYVQAAVYDAVVKIEHRYWPYVGFSLGAGNASPEAAVVAAAYSTLTHYLGDPSGTLAAEYAASLSALPNNAATQRGIAVGRAAATEIEAVRFADGRNAPTAIYGAPGPVVAGAWQVVPPFTTAQTPWVAFMEPFMLRNSAQFRVSPAPSLDSAQYAADFNETKSYGSATSAFRTADQTAIAYFWNANTVNQDNQLYRDVAAQHGMDLVDTVRLFAMGNMTASDAGIACFDSKYHYLRWRPYTAIRNADLDGNAATGADPAWTPLLATPNHPEYPAAHGCVTSAVTDVIAKALGTSPDRHHALGSDERWLDARDVEALRHRRAGSEPGRRCPRLGGPPLAFVGDRRRNARQQRGRLGAGPVLPAARQAPVK